MTPKRPTKTQPAGEVLAGRYRLEEPVAAGGMGEVWRATDTLLERSVAVKILRDGLSDDPVVSERFRREALLAAQVSHPNMAGVYDYIDNGRRAIVMEFVDGETLATRLARDGRLDGGEAVRITAGLLSALQAAHDAGIVHRDVKPGNVMLTATGGVKVTDFGIARGAADQSITETGMVVGTAQYLAPEQVSGKAATPASDLYSVGAILYEMLSGRKPFQAETPLAVAMMRLTEDPPPFTSDDVAGPLAQVVARAMARDPDERHTSADEMREALESALGSAQPATMPVPVGPDPTQQLPVDEMAGATVTFRKPETPVSPVAEKRRREYKRLGLWAIVLGLVIALIVMGALALTGGGEKSSTVAVPAFTGKSLAEAEQLADEAELELSVQHANSTQPRDTVLFQDIPEGTMIASGQTVGLTVSSGSPPAPEGIEIPDLEGIDEDEAREQLKALGLKVDDVTQESSTVAEEGKVIRTNPPAGASVAEGDSVDIVVSSGEPRRKKGRGNGNEG